MNQDQIDVCYHTEVEPSTEKALHEGHIDEFRQSPQAARVVNGPETVVLSKCGCDVDGDRVTYPDSNGKINVLYYCIGDPVRYAVKRLLNQV